MAADDLADLPELSTFSPGIPLVYTDPEQFNEDLGVFDNIASSRPVDVLRFQLLQCVAASAYELPLPPGWSEHTDPSGCVFFASSFRAEASWSHPLQEAFKETICFAKGLIDTGLTVDDAASSIKAHLSLAQQRAITTLQAWSGPYRDEDTGDEFFHNMVSGESDWQNPIELLQYELYARYMLLVVFMEELNATQEEPSGSVSPFSDITLTPKACQTRRSPRRSIASQRKVSPTRRKRMSQSGKADDLTPLSSPHSSYTLGTDWPALQRIASTFSRDSISTVVSALSAAVQPHAAELAGCLAIPGPRHQGKGPPPLKRPPPLARQRTGNQGVAPPKSQAPRRRIKMDIQTREPVTREGSPERERLELSIRELSPPESPVKVALSQANSGTWPPMDGVGTENTAASQSAGQASRPADVLQTPSLQPPAPQIEKPPDPPHEPPPPANVAPPEPNRETLHVQKQAVVDSPCSDAGAPMTTLASKGGCGPIQRRLHRSDGAGSGSSSVLCTVS